MKLKNKNLTAWHDQKVGGKPKKSTNRALGKYVHRVDKLIRTPEIMFTNNTHGSK